MHLILASLILWATATQAAAEELDVEKYIADGAVMLFWNACVKFYPDPKKFEEWIGSNSFDVVPKEQVGRPIREKGGKIYSVNNNGVRYLLAVEPENRCTVFVKEVNLKFAGQAFDMWQEGLKTKDWVKFDSMTTDKKASDSLRTTSYEYALHGRPVLNIVVSEAITRSGFFQLAMSATMQRRANHSLQPDSPDGPGPEIKR